MKQKKNKDPFESLDEQYKDMITSMGEQEIRNQITITALNQSELMEAKTKDQHLTEAKEVAKEAGAIYREGTKMNKLRIEYARQVLEGMGKI